MNTDKKIETGISANTDGALLTVVIPVYNRAEIVKATLRSLEQQTLRPLKIILVDNNSTDNTLDVLAGWKQKVETPEFKVTIFTENQPGAAAARNRGLENVDTPLTIFFDSDDIMLPTHCQRVIDGFIANPKADIIGWDCFTSKGIHLPFCVKDAFWANIFYGSMSTQRYAAKTEMFKRAGRWNPICKGWNDVEMGQRLLNLSPEMVKLSGESTICVVRIPDSITGIAFSDKPQVWEHALDLMEQSALHGDTRLKRYLNFRRAILAGDYKSEGRPNQARRLLALAQEKEPLLCYRIIYKLAAHYRGKGWRGIARLLRPLFKTYRIN